MEAMVVVVMGVAYAGMPGPVNVETVRRGLGGGLNLALAVQSGAWLGRVVYAIVVTFGAGLLAPWESAQWLVGLAGGAFLVYLGLKTIGDAAHFASQVGVQQPGVRRTAVDAVRAGGVLALASPYAILFWLSVPFLSEYRGLGGFTFLFCFFLGCLIASSAWALLTAWGEMMVTARSGRLIAWLCGIVLVGYGLKMGYPLLSNPAPFLETPLYPLAKVALDFFIP